jgi:phosphoribosylanthranilate isomerase
MSVRVKICGVTRREDVDAAVAAGVDLLGLNFYAGSRRSVSFALARELMTDVPGVVKAVGVCVQPEAEFLAEMLREVPALHAVQWHGGGPPTALAVPLVPAFRVADVAGVDAIRAYLASCTRPPLAILVDADVPGQHGGTGVTVPWHLLAGVDFGVPLILAGGLTPDNVADAVRRVRPWAVDVASGVESAPGIKDAGKVRAFVQAAREA